MGCLPAKSVDILATTIFSTTNHFLTTATSALAAVNLTEVSLLTTIVKYNKSRLYLHRKMGITRGIPILYLRQESCSATQYFENVRKIQVFSSLYNQLNYNQVKL